MQGANKAFIAGKAQWLKNNFILYNVQSQAANPFGQPVIAGDVAGTAAKGTGGELPVELFDLREIPSLTARSGVTVPAYRLFWMGERKKGWFTHDIAAYFLPWGTGKSYEGTLGTAADFFFTPTLNGCSFAASDAANPRVVHSNFANTATQKIDQTAINTDLNNIFGVAGPDLTLKKADYKRAAAGNVDYRATIIGIRGTAGWRFYFQRYKTDLVDTGDGTKVEITPLTMRRRVT